MMPDTLYAAIQVAEGIPAPLQWLGSMLFGTGIAWLALKERLRNHFWTRDEGEGTMSLVMQARDRADDNRDRIGVVEAEARHQADRIQESLIEPLKGISMRLDSISAQQAAQGEAIKGLAKSLDNLRGDV